MKYIYIILLILLSSLSFAYNVGELFNITTVPMCNDYNKINIRSEGNITKETIYPIGNCQYTGVNMYECNCTENNTIYLNATSAGLFNVYITYYVSSVLNDTMAEILNSRLIEIKDIQVGNIEPDSDITILIKGLQEKGYDKNILYGIIIIILIILLVSGVLIYKFIIVPFNKQI